MNQPNSGKFFIYFDKFTDAFLLIIEELFIEVVSSFSKTNLPSILPLPIKRLSSKCNNLNLVRKDQTNLDYICLNQLLN